MNSKFNFAAILAPRKKMLVVFQQVLAATLTRTKYIAILLLLLNSGSFPLIWHIRLMSALTRLGFSLQWHRLTHFYLGKRRKEEALAVWYEAYQPIGVHPFRAVWTYRRWAGFDDADYNLHMSNSSYAKVLDSARFRFAAASFPNVFRSGGWMALAATHFHFIHEIPMLSSYEVRTRIGAWDGKWIWCVSRFVKPLPKNARTKSKSGSVSSPGSDPEIEFNSKDPDTLSRALLQCASKTTEPDGAMLYCVAVSKLCCKHGRITIPPALVLAANGFYALPESISKSASATTLSNHRAGRDIASLPHWPTVRTLAVSMPALAKFYMGGWRDVPEGERWWEDALAACEQERLKRLVPFVGPGTEETMAARKGGLTGGLDGAWHLE
ncbi:Peptidase A1 domain-containing protein [Mycena sanguinolenta]|uniref:Peptidase A1 domain-containing protein n=1 Tax=Mycena sanguinolenta TaxID=230812 RepID=A0A8H6X3J2_9AGAR|nr:Peptidase A1 domain-containing protein [Mycena sanguinolenta]